MWPGKFKYFQLHATAINGGSGGQKGQKNILQSSTSNGNQ